MELLVVIAIIGILVALLCCYRRIQAAREAARRAQCQNNLKNVALAVLNYESAYKKFPPGVYQSQHRPTNEAWGWAVFALPYLEEQGIYDQLRPSNTFVSPVDGTRKGRRNLADVFAAGATNASGNCSSANAAFYFSLPVRIPHQALGALRSTGSGGFVVEATTLAQRRMTLACSMDRKYLWGRIPVSSRSKEASFLPSASNYVGNHGTVDSPCAGSLDASGNWVPSQGVCNSNGVFFGNSQVGLKQITDGSDKTFLAGERDHFCQAGTWIGAREPADSQTHSYLWTLGHAYDPPNNPLTLGYDTCTEGFSSALTRGCVLRFLRWFRPFHQRRYQFRYDDGRIFPERAPRTILAPRGAMPDWELRMLWSAFINALVARRW